MYLTEWRIHDYVVLYVNAKFHVHVHTKYTLINLLVSEVQYFVLTRG